MRPRRDWNALQKATYRWLEAFDHPEKNKFIIHLIGTNGKGSTGRTIALALEKLLDEKVGHFVSPHVHCYEERIMLQSRPIAHARSLEMQQAMKEKGEKENLPYIPYFARSMVEALLAYRDEARVLVMEAGIGGLDDCTNLLSTAMTVFTTIDFDHRDRLGDTIEEIARAKAGVLQKGSLAVSANQRSEAALVLREVAEAQGASLHFFSPTQITKTHLLWKERERPRLQFTFTGGMLSGDYEARLIGRHQLQNFGTALTALEALLAPDSRVASSLFSAAQFPSPESIQEAVHAAVAQAYLPGRLEMLSFNPMVFIDGAHNQQAAKMLVENLDALSACAPGTGKEHVLLFGMHDGKLSREEQEAFFAAFDAVYRIPVQDEEDDAVIEAMGKAMDAAYGAHPHALFVAAGSLYLLDGAAHWVEKHSSKTDERRKNQ